jgi:hypothetical protein
MAHLEQEKSSMQLQEALELKRALLTINPNLTATTISKGSVVFTNKGNFYIAIAAGKIQIDTETYFAVSPASPIAIALTGYKKKQQVNFNGQVYTIHNVE